MANDEIKFRFLRELSAGGVSCALVSTIVNPMDVVKVRLQIQRNANIQRDGIMYSGFTQSLRRIYVEEGLAGLWTPGLLATVYREMVYSSLRFAIYTSTKDAIRKLQPGKEFAFYEMFLTGLIAGGIGQALANPTDLAKIRLQSDCGKIGPDGRYVTGLKIGEVPLYKSTADCFRSIWKEGGIRALYQGTLPCTIRAAMLTGGQLAAYDKTKHLLTQHGVQDSPRTHVFCSVIAAISSTTCAAPADIIKTRIMAPNNPYKGPLDCLIKTVTREGPQALLKGWLPSYLRLGPHYVISLPLLEQLRKLAGLGYM